MRLCSLPPWPAGDPKQQAHIFAAWEIIQDELQLLLAELLQIPLPKLALKAPHLATTAGTTQSSKWLAHLLPSEADVGSPGGVGSPRKGGSKGARQAAAAANQVANVFR